MNSPGAALTPAWPELPYRQQLRAWSRGPTSGLPQGMLLRGYHCPPVWAPEPGLLEEGFLGVSPPKMTWLCLGLSSGNHNR